MYHSRDDFLFRSRPCVVRPPRDGPYTAEIPSRPPWLLFAMVGAVRGALAARPAERSHSYADHPTYRELEFAVGFDPDDELWR